MRTVDATRMRAPVERVFGGGRGRRALARAAPPLPLGPHARARTATAASSRWRPGDRSGRSGIPRGGCRRCGWTGARRRCTTATCAASPPGWTWSGRSRPAGDGDRRDDRARVDRAALAADRRAAAGVGDRPGLRPWDRLADAGRDPPGGGADDMSEPRRVVITGIGAVTPIGTGRRRPVGRAPAADARRSGASPGSIRRRSSRGSPAR